MAVLYKIGEFQVRWMSQPPQLIGMHVATINRPGIDNPAIFLTGVRAGEFELETRLDTETPAQAMDVYQLYCDAVPGHIVPLVYNGQPLAAARNGFLVVGPPRPLRVSAIKAGKGGVNGVGQLSRGTVDVMWRLRPVFV